jgi:CRP-like cAMP-binding protein
MSSSNPIPDFFKSGRLVRYRKNEIVLPGTSDTPDVFYIADGFIKAYSINDEGENYIHLIYKTGEIFPIEWAVRNQRRLIFYEALTPCRLWKVSKESFMHRVKETSEPFSLSLIEQLAEQFSLYADRLDNLEYKSAHERVVYRLFFLASRFGKKEGNKVTIKAPLTHHVIAESINLARESFSREFEELIDKGLVTMEKGEIVLTDIKELSREFSEPPSLDYWGLL